MGQSSWCEQIRRALGSINYIGESKHEAKQAQGCRPGDPVAGLYSFGYFNTVFDRSMTYTHWLGLEHSGVRTFREVDAEMTAEFLHEKEATYTPDSLRTLVACLRKLQEGLYRINWKKDDLVPAHWPIDGRNPPRGPYAPGESRAIQVWVNARYPDYGQALQFILASGARIDETLHLRADKVFRDEKRVELLGKGGRVRKIQLLHSAVLDELDLSRPFVYLNEEQGELWKDGLERQVRHACDTLGIKRRGVHGFRATAACEFVDIKRALGDTEMEARRELAMWLGHNPQRKEVTYAYVPKHR